MDTNALRKISEKSRLQSLIYHKATIDLRTAISASATVLEVLSDLAEAMAHDGVKQPEENYQPQLTLGQFIDLLREYPNNSDSCYYEFAMLPVKEPDSYRGYYDQLALGIGSDTVGRSQVRDVLAWCENAVGKTYTGYKGGEYLMTKKTKLWAANYGLTGSQAIIGRDKSVDYAFVIKTSVLD